MKNDMATKMKVNNVLEIITEQTENASEDQRETPATVLHILEGCEQIALLN